MLLINLQFLTSILLWERPNAPPSSIAEQLIKVQFSIVNFLFSLKSPCAKIAPPTQAVQLIKFELITLFLPCAIHIAPACCCEEVLIKLQFISVLSIITVNCPVSSTCVLSVTLELVKFTFLKVDLFKSATHDPEVIPSNNTLVAFALVKPEKNPIKEF